MKYEDFYDIAVYANKNWRGKFTQKEIACNAYENLVEFQKSNNSGEATANMQALINALTEDAQNGSKEAEEFLQKIKDSEKVKDGLHQVAAECNNDWIPIDDKGKKPAENQLVYVSVDYSKGLNCRGLSMAPSEEVIEARYINGTFLRESTGTCVDFIAKAWQPRYVPEPYYDQERSQ